MHWPSFWYGVAAPYLAAIAYLIMAGTITLFFELKAKQKMNHCGIPNCPTCMPRRPHGQVEEELADRINGIRLDLEDQTSDTITINFDVILFMRVLTAIRQPQTLSSDDKEHLEIWVRHVVNQLPLPPQDTDLLNRLWALHD
ncbi:hypothetical protein [Roseimaritima ulvae]|uniref:Uncharacterized protein n=1 Tax=Roseimaritima ulvae TaxID=980254 RepID=A0A5B9QTQ4_9BACT|nr:hypothetical protein [Roseimaritima ulvae]QEG40456.1 hypothetical protein UC8_24680 [Roseimaritima ulvae]